MWMISNLSGQRELDVNSVNTEYSSCAEINVIEHECPQCTILLTIGQKNIFFSLYISILWY